MSTASKEGGSVGDGCGSFWCRGMCPPCASLTNRLRRFDVPPTRSFRHHNYICVECGRVCAEPVEAYTESATPPANEQDKA
jgi:hypothetical protein